MEFCRLQNGNGTATNNWGKWISKQSRHKGRAKLKDKIPILNTGQNSTIFKPFCSLYS